MNYKTIAAVLVLACAGSAYAAPTFAGRQAAFFDINKKAVQSFAAQSGVNFNESDQYRRLMQTFSSNPNTGNSSLFASTAGTGYQGGGGITNGITAPVPEPETYAMMVAGLLIIGSVARRRRSQR